MSNLLSISEAAKILGVSTSTLRRWEEEGRLEPDSRTIGGQRRYKLSSLLPGKLPKSSGITIAYARVSSKDQKEDLKRQEEVLSLYCARHGWAYELISDLGSGINYQKKA